MKTPAAVAVGVVWLTGCAVGVCGLFLIFQTWMAFDYATRGRIFGPDYSATTVTPNGARLAVTMVVSSPLGRSEHQRGLKIEYGEAVLHTKMLDDWGPATRTSVYETGENGIAVLGPAGEELFFALKPLRQTRHPVNRDSSQWTYLGAFDLRGVVQTNGEHRRDLTFNTDQAAECIPTLMAGEPGGAYRTAAYRTSC